MQLFALVLIAPVGIVGLIAAWKAAGKGPAGGSDLAAFRRGAIISFATAAAYAVLFAMPAVFAALPKTVSVPDVERFILLLGAAGAADFAFSVLTVGGYTVAYLVFERFRRTRA
ncbi:hypothetical protein [Frigidibacter sp. SD6-1]|uniref:hypothetical protein n=1 Tax=Frigidibacter sp. SD6-1 TaxID=3032581 RepID=UPI0024DF41FF|nr:hypothetical protein [Frigidibacter sp. SD6-1]